MPDLEKGMTNEEILYCLEPPTQYGNLVIKKFVDYNSEFRWKYYLHIKILQIQVIHQCTYQFCNHGHISLPCAAFCCDDKTMRLLTTERDSEPASFYKKMQHNHQLQHYFQQGGAYYICWQQLERQQFITKNSNLD
jgi:hypothetical protein